MLYYVRSASGPLYGKDALCQVNDDWNSGHGDHCGECEQLGGVFIVAVVSKREHCARGSTGAGGRQEYCAEYFVIKGKKRKTYQHDQGQDQQFDGGYQIKSTVF